MNTKTPTLIFLNSPVSEFKEQLDIIRKELQQRGIEDVCMITQNEFGVHKNPTEQAQAIIKALEEKKCIPLPQPEPEVYSQEDEEKIKKRLEDLGYL